VRDGIWWRCRRIVQILDVGKYVREADGSAQCMVRSLFLSIYHLGTEGMSVSLYLVPLNTHSKHPRCGQMHSRDGRGRQERAMHVPFLSIYHLRTGGTGA